MSSVNRIPRLRVKAIADRIWDLDFGYESETGSEEVWKCALDLASDIFLMPWDRARIESEDRNQRTLERAVERFGRSCDITPLGTMLRASAKISRELLEYSVINTVFGEARL